ncbi:hypothetical protein [Roseicitreum antarcticum]|uniref:Uncharacterized protein n=1 Tax=Roseicitreum antarcticum TaxID=564137 RepID=A0A1H3E734_9RHOB|nr:hypothetical protein [Roseicitreum antarcticum]SDX73744.1 hypothetical protein SAMN04488238_11811 [Roseicitreum antarcticum]
MLDYRNIEKPARLNKIEGYAVFAGLIGLLAVMASNAAGFVVATWAGAAVAVPAFGIGWLASLIALIGAYAILRLDWSIQDMNSIQTDEAYELSKKVLKTRRFVERWQLFVVLLALSQVLTGALLVASTINPT